MSQWIRKGDRVLVIAGNDKGKSGEVLFCEEDRVIVQGINIRKKHLRRTQQTQQGGRIVEMERPIHISNVCLCDKEDNPLHIRVRQNEKGERELVFRKGTKETLYRSVKKGM